MAIKLYHCAHARSMRCVWTLEEMGLDYELVTLEFPPRAHHKDYKQVNPLGTVPCLIDGDAWMTESGAICHYLVDCYGPTPLRVAPDEPDYPLWLDWLHRSDATLTFPQTLVFRYRDLEPEERQVPQVVEDYRIWFLARLRVLEAALETRDYLCAGRFTIADIAIVWALHFAGRIGIGEAFTPNIQAYWDRTTARPAFARAAAL